MKKIGSAVAAVAMIGGLLGSSIAFQALAATHTLQFVETPAVSLYASESFNATSLVVTPVPLDLDGSVLTMSSFGSSPTLTVDPGIVGAEEIESFTSITNNGNNTATIGGLTRDLNSQYPYGAGSTGQSHGAGATVVFSNNPQLYNRLASWENDGSITGAWSFITQPTYLTTPTFVNPLALASVGFVLSTAIQGAGTSTEGTMGIVQLATQAQVGTGVASSTSGQPLVIENKFASSTYNPGSVFQGEIPTLNSVFKIDPNFIATSSAFTYNFGAFINLQGTTTQTGSGGFLNTASTTLLGTTTSSGITSINKEGQTFTSATTTASWPLPMVVATSTGKVTTGESLDASSTIGFIGFTQGIVTNGAQAFVQTSGIVSGFTGLTTGVDYYLQDNGTIGITAGTNEMYVGTALSSTQLVLESPRQLQYVGGASEAASMAAPPYARFAFCNFIALQSSGNVLEGEITLNRIGKNSGALQILNSGPGGAASNRYNLSASWSGNVISVSASEQDHGNTMTLGSGSCSYYR